MYRELDSAGALQEPFHVASYDVDLNINSCADFVILNDRRGLGVRNDRYLERIRRDRIDRQAHSVHGDRSLAGNIPAEPGRHGDTDASGPGGVADRRDGGRRIDMTVGSRTPKGSRTDRFSMSVSCRI